MPLDKATLERYIVDVSGDDQELANALREKLGAKEDAATRFVGGFMRTSDYTRKTQDLATQRQQLDSLQQDYEARLGQADQEKNKIMQDLANERISASRAAAMLQTVKDAYGLTDNDIPGLADIKATANSGQVVDSTRALDDRFKQFEEHLMGRINNAVIPEVMGVARLIPIWNGISDEHQELFGKKLTKPEQDEILAEASRRGTAVYSVWQEKYGIPDKRLEVRDESNKKKWRQEWDDDLRKKHQEEALSGVRVGADAAFMRERESPIFRRNFMPKEEPQPNGAPPPQPPPGQRTDAQRERMSGAERAAAIFTERAKNGELGKPLTERRAT